MAEDVDHSASSVLSPAAVAGTATPRDPWHGAFVLDVFVDRANVAQGSRRARVGPLDIEQIVRAAVEEFARRLGLAVADGTGTRRAGEAAEPQKPAVVCRRVFCFTARAVNVHPDDEALLEREEASLASVAGLRNVEVLAVPLDFRGHHYRAGRRLAGPTRAERTFRAVEKGVDVALASHLVQRCLAPDRTDGILLVSGDADFAPALQQVVRLEPPVVAMVAAFANSVSSLYRNTAVTGHAPIILDKFLKSMCANRNPPFREGGHIMIAPRPRKPGSQKPGNGTGGRPDPCADLALGTAAVARPHYGRLEVYLKAEGVLGARFLSEANGGKYGTTHGVRECFSRPDTYQGWAYTDAGRGVVFRFVEGEEGQAPAALLSVETPDGRVGLARDCVGSDGLAQGDWVAFYVGHPKYRRNATPLRQVSHVFPLNEKRPLLLAQLVAAGRLGFPQHAEVVEKFLEALPGLDEVLASQDAEAVRAALTRLSDDPKVPDNLRMVARAERARLGVPGQETKPVGPGTPETGKASGASSDSAAKEKRPQAPPRPRRRPNPGLGDIEDLDLRLD